MVSKTKHDLGYQAWRAFHQIRITLLPPLVRHLSEQTGLSEAEYQVFIGLGTSETGRLKPSELAQQIGWEMGRLSHQVSRMEAKGLLSREQDPDDARSCWIGATKQGKALMAKAIPLQRREIERLFTSALTDTQLRALIDIADSIEAHLDSVGQLSSK